MTRERRTAIGAWAWMALLVTTLVALHRLEGAYAPLPDESIGTWLATSDPAGVVFAGVRLAALVSGWYLLTATVLALGLEAAGLARGAAAVLQLSPHLVRRIVNAAAGAALAVGPVSPAGALDVVRSPPPAEAAEVTEEHAADPITMRRVEETPATGDITMRRLRDDGSASVDGSPRTWTLAPGQHLWLVAREVVTGASTTPPSDRQIDAYWRRLIAANRHRLVAPDNPDLVYPGQVLDLPDLSDPDV